MLAAALLNLRCEHGSGVDPKSTVVSFLANHIDYSDMDEQALKRNDILLKGTITHGPGFQLP